MLRPTRKGIMRMEYLRTNKGFWRTFFLSIVTLGIYPLYLIYAFARETNIACARDGKKTQGLLVYLILSFISLGIYAIVWHCLWIDRCNDYLVLNRKHEGLQVSTYLLTLFLFGPLTLGIMYIIVACKMLYLQNEVNATYNAVGV